MLLWYEYEWTASPNLICLFMLLSTFALLVIPGSYLDLKEIDE